MGWGVDRKIAGNIHLADHTRYCLFIIGRSLVSPDFLKLGFLKSDKLTL
jgi:hypothetical protein